MNEDHRPAVGKTVTAGFGDPPREATPEPSERQLSGGHLLAAISTSIVGILRDHYGAAR